MPNVRLTHPGIPGNEIITATQEQFEQIFGPSGWILADPELQPDRPYYIPSTEKGAPFGVATLDANGDVVQFGGGGGGDGVTDDEVVAIVTFMLAGLTAADVGAIPNTTPALLYVNDTVEFKQRATHPAPKAGVAQAYGLSGDGSTWVQVPSGQRTQLAPGLEIINAVLGVEAVIDQATLEDVMTVQVAADTTYEMWLRFTYETEMSGSSGTGQLRNAFTVPTGATGSWGALAQNSGVSVSTGTAPPNFRGKRWSETIDMGGSGAGVACSALIHGTLNTDEAGAFTWRCRLGVDGTTDAKIYGVDTPDFAGARLTLIPVGT